VYGIGDRRPGFVDQTNGAVLYCAVRQEIELKDIALLQVPGVEIAIVGDGKYIVIDAVGHVVLPCLYVA
jgi:hypothetical protein